MLDYKLPGPVFSRLNRRREKRGRFAVAKILPRQKPKKSIRAALLAFFFISFASISLAQEFLPAPPSDRKLVYILDEQNRLVPLPNELGLTPLHTEQVSKSDRVSYIELKGEHASTILTTSTPRWFLFTHQRPGAHPPFLVWLTPRHRARRVTAIAQRGMAGFAISSEEIIKPAVRVLASLGGDEVFMELRPRNSLISGEYAIIGDDLTRIATFRVVLQP